MSRAKPMMFAFLLLAACVSAFAQGARPQGPAQSIEDRTARMRKIDGLFPLYWDEAAGQLFMAISKLNTESLHSTGSAAGF